MSAACVTASFRIRSMVYSVLLVLQTRRSSGIMICIIVKGSPIAKYLLKLLIFYICAKLINSNDCHAAEDVPITILWCS